MKKRLAATRTSFAMVLCLGGLLGCVQQTYYTPASNGYGYAERQISPERYQVVFAGNHKTQSRDRPSICAVPSSAARRSGKGFSYVAVNDQSQRIERYGDLTLAANPTRSIWAWRTAYGGSRRFRPKPE